MQTDDGPEKEEIDVKAIMNAWNKEGYILVSTFTEVRDVVGTLKMHGEILCSLFFGYDDGGILISKIM